MAIRSPSAPHSTAADTISTLLPSWRRSLAVRASDRTAATYTISARQLEDYLTERGMPTSVPRITREHVEAFITDLMATKAPATAHNRFRGCQAFFRWLVDEGEIKASPMERMRPPKLPEAPPPVLTDAQLRKLLAACERDKSPMGRRDEAIIRTLVDSGIRRGELLGLRVDDVDMEGGLLTVTGKAGRSQGPRTRHVPIGATTVRSIDRWQRSRSKRTDAREPWLWLGRKGRLQETGLAELIRSRGQEAGLKVRLHPHLFRHAYADSMLAAGMQETDLMAIAGWKSRDMVARYAAANRAQRAIQAARTLRTPADRLEERER